MGNYFGRMENENLESVNSDNSDDDDLFQNEIQDNGDLNQHYLVLILRQLIDR